MSDRSDNQVDGKRKSTAKEDTDKDQVLFVDKPKWTLVGLGLILLLLFGGGVGFTRLVGSETTETSPPTITGQTITAAITKTTKTKSIPSDTVLTAILASGTALILVGVLYYRISSLKLPGGAEVALTPKEQKEATKTAEKNVPDTADKDTKAEAKRAALKRVREEKNAVGVLEFEADTVRRLAREAVQQVIQ
jgi:hypothetical protein